MKQDDEILTIKKQMRQKEAEFMKEKALLVQQVELLKMQLGESAEREQNLKKMNENIMNAIQNQSDNSPGKIKIEINEDHPDVVEIIRKIRQEFEQRTIKEKERFRESEYSLEKQNQQLEFKCQDLIRKNETLAKDYETKTLQHSLLLDKYNSDIQNVHEKVQKDHEHIIIRLQNELEVINSDIERQVMFKLNQKYLNEQDLNETIIKYQKEQQQLLEEQIEFRKKIEYLEKELTLAQDKVSRVEDEKNSIILKGKQTEKKLKEENEMIKKQKDDTQKKLEDLEKKKKPSTSTLRNNPNTTQGNLKSRNKTSIYQQNKENIRGNQTDFLTDDQTTDANDDDDINKLRRQLALYRCQVKKLMIEIKDLKSNHTKEIAKLKDQLNVEKKKRMNIYEEKVDKNNQLLQDLLEKDQTIFNLNRQLSKVQDQLASNNQRTHTPNHLLQSLQESMVQNAFTSSMIDLANNFGNNHSSKRLISPLRSLDLTLLNNQNLSFNVKPKTKREKRDKSKSKPLMISPKQIKRARVHSVRVNNRASQNILSQSITRPKGTSRDASIAEVNEDLYRDSVESDHNSNDQIIDRTHITLKRFESEKEQRQKFVELRADEELNNILMQDKTKKKDIYYDSLENHSSDKDIHDNYYKQTTSAILPPQIRSNQPKHDIVQKNIRKLKEKSNKKNKDQYEDDDCLVNILDQEDTHIEVQPTLLHTRQHLSTENLMNNITNTIENLQSFRNLKQKFPLEKKQSFGATITHQNNKVKSILPKPYNTFQKHLSTKQPSVQNSNKKFEQFKSNNSQQPNFGDNIMKSPSSPNLNYLPQRNLQQSSSSKKGQLRLDSCPSPLDENETVFVLGSGEKLRVQEVNSSKLDAYANAFKEQRQKFSATTTFRPPQSNKNQNTNTNSGQFSFRTRTNSLINSVCSEICLKMKFMPSTENIQPLKQPIFGGHGRKPSMNVSTSSSLISKQISPRPFK